MLLPPARGKARLTPPLCFPRKGQSTKFPAASLISVPNLLKFVLHHSSPPALATAWGPGLNGGLWRETVLQQVRIARLEGEIEVLKAEIQALHRAQGQLQGQLSDAQRQSRRLQREAHALREQQSHQEQLQGLCSQETWQLGDTAEKLRELADASETLLAENAFLKVLLASTERRQAAEPSPERGLPHKETASLPAPGQDRSPQMEKDGAAPLNGRVPTEHSKENWTE